MTFSIILLFLTANDMILSQFMYFVVLRVFIYF